LDIFAKLGARYLLVEKEGCLVGIITRKDVLRYEYTVHEHNRDNVQQANHICKNSNHQLGGKSVFFRHEIPLTGHQGEICAAAIVDGISF